MKAPKPKAFDPVPKGTHVARLYSIIHLGTTSFIYKGEEKSSNKIRLAFELCNERKEFKEGEGERPFSIAREFGWSMSPRGKLRPFIEGMVGTALDDDEAYNLDIETLLGEACLVTVVHEEKNGNTYSNILTASGLPKGTIAPKMFNEPKFISVDSTPVEEIAALPDFLKEKIYASEEWGLRMRAIEILGQSEPKPEDYRPASVRLPKSDEGEVAAEDEPDII